MTPPTPSSPVTMTDLFIRVLVDDHQRMLREGAARARARRRALWHRRMPTTRR